MSKRSGERVRGGHSKRAKTTSRSISREDNEPLAPAILTTPAEPAGRWKGNNNLTCFKLAYLRHRGKCDWYHNQTKLGVLSDVAHDMVTNSEVKNMPSSESEMLEILRSKARTKTFQKWLQTDGTSF